MKKYSAFVLFSFTLIFAFTSCISIPFENSVREKNIAAEYFNIGQSYENLKNYNKAIEYYSMVENNPEYKTVCIYKIARCYALNKNWDKSAQYYEMLLEQDRDNISVKQSLAYVYAMGGKSEKAIVLYDSIILDAGQKDIFLEEAVYKNYLTILIQMEKIEKAQEVVELYEKFFPESESLKSLKEKLSK